MTTQNRERIDVLISGGGPAGVVSALLLAKLGVSSIVVEKNVQTDEHPKAHELNARSVEILRELGITEDELKVEASPFEDGSRVVFCREINQEIGRIDLLDDPERVAKYAEHFRSDLPYFNLSQSEFEKLLVRRATDTPGAEIRFRHQWESLEELDDCVVSTIRDLETDSTYEVESRYLIAADGAGSPCRRAVGIEMDGPAEIQNFLNAYFRLNLREHLDTPAKLYWIFHPKYAGAFIAHHIERRWVYALPLNTPWDSAEDYPNEVLADRIRGALNYDGDIEILSVSSWRMSAQVAQSYRAGRVLLVGDSAHRFPPTGGLGMNTGIPDAHNVCWKIAAVIRGDAPDALLDTYEAERRPIAQQNCAESRTNYEKMWNVIEAMGVPPDGMRTQAKLLGNKFVRAFPNAVRRLIAAVMAIPADAIIKRTLKPGQVRDRVRAEIAKQLPHFDRIGLDIGYRYETGALIPDGCAPPEVDDPVTQYVPTCMPGARLPHAWLQRGQERCSTHDLIPYDRFTLLTRGHAPWHSAAEDAAQAFGIQLDVIALGDDITDPDQRFTEITELTETGALLIRSDHHIAWRSKECGEDPSGVLANVLETILRSERKTAAPA